MEAIGGAHTPLPGPGPLIARVIHDTKPMRCAAGRSPLPTNHGGRRPVKVALAFVGGTHLIVVAILLSLTGFCALSGGLGPPCADDTAGDQPREQRRALLHQHLVSGSEWVSLVGQT